MLRLLRALPLLAAALPGGLGASPVCPGNATADDMLRGKNFSGRVAVVTGGDSGLGFSIATALAKRGASVVIGNRNLTSGKIAAKNISDATGASVTALALDLSLLSSVRAFAKGVLATVGHKLDFLINNAGITSPSRLSKDGFELVFEIDYLGHFLLTELLLPVLRNGTGARVVNVASGAHENACEAAGWPKDCFKDWTYLPPPVVPAKNVTIHYRTGTWVTKSSSYGIAKFLNVQHAAAIAQRERSTGVQAFSLTPGFATTGMTSKIDPKSPTIKMICSGQEHPDPSIPQNPCPFTADQGAAVIAFCAAGEAQNGAYYSRTWACEPRAPVMQGFTEAMQLELYERSLMWAGVGSSAGDAAAMYV